MLDGWKAWWRRQDDILTLQGLSDRMLADMGVERRAIRELVTGPAEPEGDRARGGEPPRGLGARAAAG